MKNWVLIVVALLIAAAPMFFLDADFEGADAGAETVVAENAPDYEPWAAPLVGELPGEVESGLFALQAALGAGVLGYALGFYRGRNRESDRASSTS